MTARRLNKILVAILIPLAVFAFLSAGTAAWMWRNPGAVMAVRQAVDLYPPELRRAIRAEFEISRDKVAGDIARVDENRRRLFELLRAGTLDEEEVRTAMTEVREAVNDLQATGQEHLLKVMLEADPADRAKIRVPEKGFLERIQKFAD